MGEGSATSAVVKSPQQAPGVFRRFLELMFMLASAIMVLFMWDTTTRAQDENSALRGELRRVKARGENADTAACTVCLENPREVVLTACGHVCLCTTCAERIRYRDNRCPVCRKDIENIKPVYIS